EMLAGRSPFAAPDLSRLFLAVLNAPAPRLPEDVPAHLHLFVGRCLAKRREDRAASCDELLRILERASDSRVAVGARAAAPAEGLVGRAAEVGRLDAMLDRVARGEVVSAVVSGDLGVGKTSLLDEAKA